MVFSTDNFPRKMISIVGRDYGGDFWETVHGVSKILDGALPPRIGDTREGRKERGVRETATGSE